MIDALRCNDAWRRTAPILAACLIGLGTLGASPAAAAGFFSMQGGLFGPWQGDLGYNLGVQMLGGGASGRARFGGEFSYRNFDTHVLGVPDVDVDAYSLRGVWQQHIVPAAVVSPYLGLTFGITFTNVDNDRVNDAYGIKLRGESGFAIEGQFLAGVDAKIPTTDYLSVFVEGRVGFGYELSDRDDKTKIESENIGGVQGLSGIRFRF